MMDHKYESKILTSIVNSNEMRFFAQTLQDDKKDLIFMAQQLYQQITLIAEIAISAYKTQREEFNHEADQKDRIFIFPSVREKSSIDRRYSTFRWLQYVNATYNSRLSTKKQWTVREVKKVGKNFSEADFKRVLTNKLNPFLSTILETEHILRFCRQHYQTINAIHKLVQSKNFSEATISELLTGGHGKNDGVFLEDPLRVNKSESLFNDFYTPSPSHIDVNDDDEDEKEKKSDQEILDDIFREEQEVYF